MNPLTTAHSKLKEQFDKFRDRRGVTEIIGKDMLIFPRCKDKHWTLYVVNMNTLKKTNLLPSCVLYFNSLDTDIPPDKEFVKTVIDGIISTYKLYDTIKDNVVISNYESNVLDDVETLENIQVKVVDCKFINFSLFI